MYQLHVVKGPVRVICRALNPPMSSGTGGGGGIRVDECGGFKYHDVRHSFPLAYEVITGVYVDEMGHYGGVTREKVVSN